PVDTVPKPGVTENIVVHVGPLNVMPSKHDNLLMIGVISHGCENASRWDVNGIHLLPVGSVPHPGVVEGLSLAVKSAEKHDLFARGVIRHRVAGSCRGRLRGLSLLPIRTVPYPCVAIIDLRTLPRERGRRILSCECP